MRQIQLRPGIFTIVDDDDYDWLYKYYWYLDGQGYVIGVVPNLNGIFRPTSMHRLIMNAPRNLLVDHKDGNTLNNVKENLRICTKSQNTANSKKRKNTLSCYKGVTRHRGRWLAQIRHNGKLKFLGYFPSEHEAALAYNQAAIDCHGEFARLNNI